MQQNSYIRKHSACKQKNLLYELKLEKLWGNQDREEKINYYSIIQTRLTEYFREQWIKSAKHSHKGLDYLELTMFNCDMKPHLNFIMEDRSVLSTLKIRTGNHELSIEVDCYRNRKVYNECICNACNTGEVEDIQAYYVLVECPEYANTRLKKPKLPYEQHQNRIL